MTLVEAVLGKEHHLIKEFVGHFHIDTALFRTLHKNAAMLLHLGHLFLTHRPTQEVCLPQGISR